MKLTRLFTAVALLFISSFSWGQDYQFGVEISPSFDFQLQTASNNTWSTVRGNGFLLGLFADKRLNEHTFIGTGLKYEYVAFNQKSGDFLVESFRISSLNIPITFKQEIGVTKNWFYNVGAGLNYNFLVRQFFIGNFININPLMNQWQPYVNVGLNYLIDSHFEIGSHARFHFLDLYSQENQNLTQTNARLFSFDFSLRYTFSAK